MSIEREILSNSLEPTNYDISLEPNFTDFTFNGEIVVDLKCNEPSKDIQLNTSEIEYFTIKVDDVEIDAKDYSIDESLERLIINHEVSKDVKLYIKFKGILNDNMCGFYKSSYEEDGKTKYLATTQMEAVDCRKAFPCFDEPAVKSTFEISLIADKELTCLSNMDVKSTEDLGEKKKVVFHKTPKMSTYLVAFIVGDLKYVENNDYNVPIRVYSTSDEHLGKYAADITAKTLKFFDKAFDIPYPLPKCDLVAIHDFAAGAMENYGLITFRTAELLINPEEANANVLKRITEVVMHELAHQWFGNLVTMEWWEGLWLNEGFATWMSWYACDSLYPEWKVWESYVTDDLQAALSLDGLRSSHPIEIPLKRANDVNQIFDSISYAKGSSLLKMISVWLGEETFVKGVSNYLKKFKWGNTKTTDLWDCLSEASGKDVNNVMGVWTKNMGYPVVSVKELGNQEFEITQNRFLTTGDVKPEEDEIVYPVFLSIKTDEGIKNVELFEKSTKIKLDGDFFKINANQANIYRTAYELDRWVKLGSAADKLSVEDRVGLVTDAYALSTAGNIPTTSFLNLVKLWTNEDSYVVWEGIIGNLASIRANLIFEDEAIRNALNKFILSLIKFKLAEIGSEFNANDSYALTKLKTTLFNTAAGCEDAKYIEICQQYFQDFLNGKKIPSQIKDLVFVVAAKYGDETTLDQILNIYKKASSIDEKLDALKALGRFKNPELKNRAIGYLTDYDLVKKQDIFRLLASLRGDKEGIEAIWKWFTVNYNKLLVDFPPEGSMFSYIVRYCVSGFTKQSQKDEVEQFFKDKDTQFYDKNLDQALDKVSSTINWIDRDLESVKSWLSTNGYKL
ncbi:alanine/arginine aminopeptidase [[Candida] jaroonii]|uniref:Alanine/arginine aminopeptidase n=1 Tax=[Candida] jaroonii TaxID=467808 RepID=A0ACA9Y568_9ASCO|nr:alanine/arginine aminopeptidase [[Candida] jaroonii]